MLDLITRCGRCDVPTDQPCGDCLRHCTCRDGVSLVDRERLALPSAIDHYRGEHALERAVRVVLALNTGHQMLHELHVTDAKGNCTHCSALLGLEIGVRAPCPTMVVAGLPADCCRAVAR